MKSEYIPEKNNLTQDSQVDCPEFLVCSKGEKRWVLEQTESLEEAKDRILTRRYKEKKPVQIIVLHNLENIRYNLFTEKSGEIIPVPKNEAHTVNRLLLSWVKS